MGADIRLLRLCRKAINDGTAEGDGNRIAAMATDYFDIIEMKKFSSKDPLMDVMGTGTECMPNPDDVSMQSYPVYCPEETIEKYKNCKKYGDPFEDINTDYMPFLSIIQVHITPEIMARMPEGNSKDFSMKLFLEDIHQLIDDFVNCNQECSMVYRVYVSLSAGDFAVIIKSENAETSFRISTILRKRTAKNIKESEVSLVAYKTYTILSLNKNVIPRYNENYNSCDDNVFVIRCCFSNKYWSEKVKIEAELNKAFPGFANRIFHLNGRYDFSIQLSEKEFKQVSQVIVDYKTGNANLGDSGQRVLEKLQTAEPFGVTDYLVYLISKGYLSYVNERYLFHMDSVASAVGDESELISVTAMDRGDKFLDSYNKEKYKELINKFHKIDVKLKRLNGFRKNLEYHMLLLNRLIILCETINGLSDTRIYAAILLKQLDSVLDNLEIYYECLIKSKDMKIHGMMECYLRKAICALDSYAGYIRNNNLQSLQTPNYSLESNASMEKFLIGFSQFLCRILEWFGNTELAREIDGNQQKLIPVLIPDLASSTMSIEVMFPQITSEEKYAKTRLMVVRCATLNSLTNVAEMTAALFHEVAHQFRYEKREERNDTLLRYIVWEAFDPWIEAICMDLKRKIPGFMNSNKIKEILKKNFAEAYLKIGFGKKKGDEKLEYEFREKPLDVFWRKIRDDISGFWEADDFWENLSSMKRAFIEQIRYGINLNDPETRENLVNFNNLEVFLENNSIKVSWELLIKRIQQWASFLWNQAHPDVEDEENIDLQVLLAKLDDIEKSGTGRIMSLIAYRKYSKDFFRELYNGLSNEWKEKGDTDLKNRYYRHIGRYLGVDYHTEENEKEFSDYMKSKMTGLGQNAEVLVNTAIIAYREQTADIFMCQMLELTAWGYLNFMSYNLPVERDFDEAYYQRFVRVLYPIWGDILELQGESCIAGEIMDKTKDALKGLIGYYDSDLSELPEVKALQEYMDRKESISRFRDDRIYQIKLDAKTLATHCMNIIKTVLQTKSTEMNDFVQQLRHYILMCKIMIGMSDRFSNQLALLRECSWMEKDLKKGAETLKLLHEEFEKDSLWKYCRAASRFWNEPFLRYDSENISKTNDEMVRFILEMYYNNKFSNAQSILAK